MRKLMTIAVMALVATTLIAGPVSAEAQSAGEVSENQLAVDTTPDTLNPVLQASIDDYLPDPEPGIINELTCMAYGLEDPGEC